MKRSRFLLVFTPLAYFFAFFTVLTILSSVFSLGVRAGDVTSIPQNPDLAAAMPKELPPKHLPKASFAGGCFWCLESEFRDRPGVVYTRVGYAGGKTENPSYESVSKGDTGHAETIEIYYDPKKTDYTALVDHFMRNAHDPTTLNKQWVDEGTQYRSVIFYHDAEQKNIAQSMIEKIDAEKVHKARIVTELIPAEKFWLAEDHHQQYYETYEKEKGSPHLRVILKSELKKKKEQEKQRGY
jgi:peptide-methionine (S)-S-oxide reductase